MQVTVVCAHDKRLDTQHSFTFSSDSTEFWKAIKASALLLLGPAVSGAPAPTAAARAAAVSSRTSAAHSHPVRVLAPPLSLHSCARTSMRQTSSDTA